MNNDQFRKKIRPQSKSRLMDWVIIKSFRTPEEAKQYRDDNYPICSAKYRKQSDGEYLLKVKTTRKLNLD